MYEVIASIDESEERARGQAEALSEIPMDPDEVHVTLFYDFVDNPEGASATQISAARRAEEILESAGFEVSMEEASGDPAENILALADERDADLVVLAGRKRSPAGKAVFGSVTQQVILNTDRPVLVCSEAET